MTEIQDNNQLLKFACENLRSVQSLILTVTDHPEYANAYEMLGVTQLATRVSELKAKGYKFRKERVKSITRFGVKTHFDRYYLVED